jgi:low temperature requirement protein LtrA
VSGTARADPAGSPTPQIARLLRNRSGLQRVTNIELFFDLVYVFAVTQLSHYLLDHPTVPGALQAGLLLVMVWLVWSYTTWVTNWLDPERMAVRLLLVVLMLISLAMSVSLPRAFEDLGLWVGASYAVQQIGRTVFMVIALRGHVLQTNFERILVWCVASGAFAVAGGIVHGSARYLLWLVAVGLDVAGGAVGFYIPGLGRSRTSDWTIEGGHFAERCQAFMLIALGESIVIIGATLTSKPVTASDVTAFVVAFVGSVALWWLYFDQSAEAAAEKIARSDDPGRLGRSAYHLIHPVMVAGIIVSAAADQKVLSDPAATASTASAWMILGGPALFLAGHVAFKLVVWRYVSWPRVAGIAVLALLALAAKAIPELGLAACAAGLVAAVAATDRLPWLPGPPADMALRLTPHPAVRVDLDRLGVRVRSPERHRHHARLHHLQALEEAGELLRAAEIVGHRTATVVALLRLVECLVGVSAVVEREIAARGQARHQAVDDGIGLVVGEVAHDSHQHERNGLGEIE